MAVDIICRGDGDVGTIHDLQSLGRTISSAFFENLSHRRKTGFYISRPTLEAARKPDKEGTTINLLRTIVKEFIEQNPLSDQYEDNFKVETQGHQEVGTPRFVILSTSLMKLIRKRSANPHCQSGVKKS